MLAVLLGLEWLVVGERGLGHVDAVDAALAVVDAVAGHLDSSDARPRDHADLVHHVEEEDAALGGDVAPDEVGHRRGGAFVPAGERDLEERVADALGRVGRGGEEGGRLHLLRLVLLVRQARPDVVGEFGVLNREVLVRLDGAPLGDEEVELLGGAHGALVHGARRRHELDRPTRDRGHEHRGDWVRAVVHRHPRADVETEGRGELRLGGAGGEIRDKLGDRPVGGRALRRGAHRDGRAGGRE